MSFSNKLAAIALAGALLTGCGAQDDMESTKAAVEDFHTQLNESRFSDIYSQSSPIFRAKSSEVELNRLLGSIRIRLGKVTNSQPDGWKVDYSMSGSEATLTYRTAVEKGSAIETFVYDLSVEPPRLAGYHIASQ